VLVVRVHRPLAAALAAEAAGLSLFGELYDQAIPIPQFGAITIKHLFGLRGRCVVIVGSNHEQY
jgi:hypothetical protein